VRMLRSAVSDVMSKPEPAAAKADEDSKD